MRLDVQGLAPHAVGGDWDALGAHGRLLLLPAPRHLPQASGDIQPSHQPTLPLIYSETQSAMPKRIHVASSVGTWQSDVNIRKFAVLQLQLYVHLGTAALFFYQAHTPRKHAVYCLCWEASRLQT